MDKSEPKKEQVNQRNARLEKKKVVMAEKRKAETPQQRSQRLEKNNQIH